jgi:hypothetical protein
MASVDGEYIGPVDLDEAVRVVEDLDAGRPVLEHKQLRYRRCVDPGVQPGSEEFDPPERDVPRADTAGLAAQDQGIDRPGPSAAIEAAPDQAEKEQ